MQARQRPIIRPPAPLFWFACTRAESRSAATGQNVGPNGLQSSASHISGTNPGAAASKEPQLEDWAVVAVRMSVLVGAAISQSTIQQPLDIGAVAWSVWTYWLEKSPP